MNYQLVIGLHLVHVGFLYFMAYTLEEQLEELQKSIDTHEEVLSSIVWALVDEGNLSLDAKDSIRDAFKLIYGRDKK